MILWSMQGLSLYFTLLLQNTNHAAMSYSQLFLEISTMRMFWTVGLELWLPGWKRYVKLLGHPLHPSTIADDYCSASVAVTKAGAGWTTSQQTARSWIVSHQSWLQEDLASSCWSLGYLYFSVTATLHPSPANWYTGTQGGTVKYFKQGRAGEIAERLRRVQKCTCII